MSFFKKTKQSKSANQTSEEEMTENTESEIMRPDPTTTTTTTEMKEEIAVLNYRLSEKESESQRLQADLDSQHADSEASHDRLVELNSKLSGAENLNFQMVSQLIDKLTVNMNAASNARADSASLRQRISDLEKQVEALDREVDEAYSLGTRCCLFWRCRRNRSRKKKT